jgi:hypothetical protein
MIPHMERLFKRSEAAYIPSAKAQGFTRPLINHKGRTLVLAAFSKSGLAGCVDGVVLMRERRRTGPSGGVAATIGRGFTG